MSRRDHNPIRRRLSSRDDLAPLLPHMQWFSVEFVESLYEAESGSHMTKELRAWLRARISAAAEFNPSVLANARADVWGQVRVDFWSVRSDMVEPKRPPSNSRIIRNVRLFECAGEIVMIYSARGVVG